MTKNKIEKIAEELGWTVTWYKNSRSKSVMFSQYSPKGQDFNVELDYETVKKIATRVEYIRYDPYAQEILSGCNTFVNINYDYDVLKKARDENIEEAKELLKGCETQSKTVLETEEGKYVIIPSHHSDGKNEWFTYCYAFFKKDESIGRHIGEFRDLYDCAWDLADKLAIHKARTAA